MIIRRTRLLVSSFLLLAGLVVGDDDVQCPMPTVNSLSYDLTKLAGEHTVSRTRETPPSTMVDSLRFNLCANLEPQEGVAEADQCPSDTRACLTKTNKKKDNTDRIIAVIPVATTTALDVHYSAISSPKGIGLILHGSSYPSSPNEIFIPQSINFTLLCNADTTSDPLFTSYEAGVVNVEWSSPAGCGIKQGDAPPSEGNDDEEKGGDGGQKEENVGSGVGWFFLVLLLAFIAYFGLGAYYNYTTYGASGVDLIPHRDFWQEVPYMARDVLSHLCSSVRSRRPSQRGGYMSV